MKFLSTTATAFLLSITASSAGVLAQPVVPNDNSNKNNGNLLSTRQDTSVPLRIMPLGASITWGTESEDGNGYRKVLYDSLEELGFSVDMVGSQQSGDMEDKDNEGHPGWRIAEVSGAADATIPEQPNVVLINAGTNDCIQDYDVATAHERMRDLVDKLLAEIPGTTVVLSTLLPNADDVVDGRVAGVNDKFRALVESMGAEDGKRVVLAEMNDGYITRDDLVEDGIHPNRNGYIKMAMIWFEAIVNASKDGVLQTPNEAV
ncbi:SGNH hydrolase-type esterase domain-containing protein [Microdochium trichocladiopsis]|uniref:SGNH hydrolase-type esterase domain-containing protein n=1 Tax=Microdochium trichocladiopsis TaxID=1682393 RepID=A0A9P8Y0J5_9PEZI|nr:SGNH hydrolase-type esterase domain-containing protein [Microdochium trichocladiopsis]KAH7025801.1 SGNH hydrolase-type esterase domain-containing protein [Microdochium trichocladiopsis]